MSARVSGVKAAARGNVSNPLYWVSANRVADEFPTTSQALREPDGLLAIGGDLTCERLLNAYRQGIFPWYSEGQPILWWAPDPRSVLYPDQIKISRSLRKTINRGVYRVTADCAFDTVIDACAEPRAKQPGTWITEPMREAYIGLHRRGNAHSVECWQEGELVGGLYGVSLGRVFFGESMFSRKTDASKVALVALAKTLSKWRYELIDCQIHNDHLASLGASPIERPTFDGLLARLCSLAPAAHAWDQDEFRV